MNENIKDILVVLLIILGGAILYSRQVRRTTELPDIKKYEKTIDSLHNIILVNKKEITRYDSINSIQQNKIKQLNIKLGNTANAAAKEHQQYEKDIKRISAMSNNDITTLFTESFN